MKISSRVKGLGGKGGGVGRVFGGEEGGLVWVGEEEGGGWLGGRDSAIVWHTSSTYTLSAQRILQYERWFGYI